jgi:hypothetical protein
MSFSDEDKLVWWNSEVMREFEKIAQENDILSGPPADSFSPIEEEEEWEEESDLESAIGDAAEVLIGEEVEPSIDEDIASGKLKVELSSLYMNNLLSNLQDLAHDLAEQGHIKVARKIEVTINTIKKGA